MVHLPHTVTHVSFTHIITMVLVFASQAGMETLVASHLYQAIAIPAMVGVMAVMDPQTMNVTCVSHMLTSLADHVCATVATVDMHAHTDQATATLTWMESMMPTKTIMVMDYQMSLAELMVTTTPTATMLMATVLQIIMNRDTGAMLTWMVYRIMWTIHMATTAPTLT